MSQCALCLEERMLVESHLIPEYLFRPLYDSKHQFERLTANPNFDHSMNKGIRYPLLCAKCDGGINTAYEQPFLKFWMEGQALNRTLCNQAIKDLDYAKFKLFHLSILWRFAACDKRYADHFDLGQHEEPLRLMVKNGDAGAFNSYPMFPQMLLKQDGSIAYDQICIPTRNFNGRYLGARMVYAGCQWSFIISPNVVLEDKDAVVSAAWPHPFGQILVTSIPLEECRAHCDLEQVRKRFLS